MCSSTTGTPGVTWARHSTPAPLQRSAGTLAANVGIRLSLRQTASTALPVSEETGRWNEVGPRYGVEVLGPPLAVLQAGQTVRLHSIYQSSHAADDVMGIMLGYVNPS